MYNKVKRKLGLAAAILSIVLGGFIIVAGLAGFCDALYELEGFAIFLSVTDLALGVLLIVFGAKQCHHPVRKDGVFEDRKPVYVALIVLLGIALFSTIFNFIIFLDYDILYGYESSGFAMAALISILAFYIACPALPLNIVSMVLKAEKKVQEVNEVDGECQQDKADEQEVAISISNDNIEQKIAQLSSLKDNGQITEEQYKKAVDKIINNFVK